MAAGLHDEVVDVIDLGRYGFVIEDAERSNSFDNEYIVLASPYLRVRVVRERGQTFVDFGPPAEPGTWFDSAVVFDLMGLSEKAGFHSSDSRAVLTGLSAFLASFGAELAALFNSQGLGEVKQRLEDLKTARARAKFGA